MWSLRGSISKSFFSSSQHITVMFRSLSSVITSSLVATYLCVCTYWSHRLPPIILPYYDRARCWSLSSVAPSRC